eukprot:3342977-Alexandrium_andersonii.AAC.1
MSRSDFRTAYRLARNAERALHTAYRASFYAVWKACKPYRWAVSHKEANSMAPSGGLLWVDTLDSKWEHLQRE